MADGAEMLVIALVTKDLETQWGLTYQQKGILGGTVFVGFLLGSLVCGPAADRIGKRERERERERESTKREHKERAQRESTKRGSELRAQNKNSFYSFVEGRRRERNLRVCI